MRDYVAIVGSRVPSYELEVAVSEAVLGLRHDAVVVTGDATGADDYASAWGVKTGRVVVVCRAPWRKLEKAAGPVRNQAIATICHRMIAFPSANPLHRGTWNAIVLARALGKEVDVREKWFHEARARIDSGARLR
jgi:hypothetical protein